MSRQKTYRVEPSASRLTASLRDIGYDFVTALADIADNSVTAGATKVDLTIEFAGEDSRVVIADNGHGMTSNQLNEALRFGSRQSYGQHDLGKFGLGLKTASLSQCRQLTVLSRASSQRRRIEARILDLDYVHYMDEWEVLAPHWKELDPEVTDLLSSEPGTVIQWTNLDRILTYADKSSHWARRRLESLTASARIYLGMVFHRYLAGTVAGREPLKMTVNGEVIQGWDPFGREETATIQLPARSIPLKIGTVTGTVRFQPFILPPRERFSSPAAFEHLSGPNKWNRQQGLYIYRAGRMIQHGGWCGIRTIDEHTKLARAAISFDPELDELFQVNVAKMRVTMPSELRNLLSKHIAELCIRANGIYREGSNTGNPGPERSRPTIGSAEDIGFAIRAAAIELGEIDAIRKVEAKIRARTPEIVDALGW